MTRKEIYKFIGQKATEIREKLGDPVAKKQTSDLVEG